MTGKFCKLSLLAGASAAALLAACGGGGGGGGQGTLQVSLTDSACGYEAVNVTVNKVRVHRSGNAGDKEGGWVDIALDPTKNRKVNLLDLTNGNIADLWQPTTLPAGRYGQIRLVLDRNSGSAFANSVVLENSNTELELETPSAVQSGIKLNNGFEVVDGQTTNLVLDFDACKSVVAKGSGAYALKPVIRIASSTVGGEPKVNGIDGYVAPALLDKNVMVAAQQNGEVVSATAPDSTTGRFFLARLEPGTYDVVITADNYATSVITKVPVASTSKVSLSTSGQPLALTGSADVANVKGAITFNPTTTTEEPVFVKAKQSFAAGPTVTVKYQGVAVPSTNSSAEYWLTKLPAAAPRLGQYSATLPITFAESSTTLGAGKYKVEASLSGYQTSSIEVDVSAGLEVADQNLTLSK